MGLQVDDLIVEQTLSATTLTATTLYVGTNNIGGSSSSFNSLSATTLSAGTLYSGSTNLYSIFLTTADGNDITRVQPGSNITTGGTGNNPTVNLVASPSVNNITFSGTAIGGTVQAGAGTFTSLSAATLSGGTILSGGTNLYSIFSTTDNNDITRVQPGSNITTGGTGNNPTINLATSPSVNNITFSGTAIGGTIQAGAGTLTSLSATTMSAGTLYSGSTNLYSIFLTTADGNDITRVQPGSNITTGGTGNNPTVSVVASPSFNSITSSGASSFTTLTATTFISGSTNLYSIFTQPSLVVNNVNAGSNIATGGTAISPTINIVASPSFNVITASGSSVFSGSLSAGTLSASTMISGSTNLYNIFLKTGSTLTHKSGTISGSTFAGNPKKATVTFSTAFANTSYAITITSDTNRTFTWESKAAGSFVINANANTGFASGNVDWTATEYGEK